MGDTDNPSTSWTGPDDAAYYNVEVREHLLVGDQWTVHRPFPPPPGQTWPFESCAALEQQVPGVARALLEGRLTVGWHRDGAGTMYELDLTPIELVRDFPEIAKALAAQGVVLQPDARLRLRVVEVPGTVPPQL